ncbi:MAG: hypothetical protein J6I46_00025 [Ruminococcus sp.]|nr:hypothetical protein [Ruminococcus sp.]
MPNIYKKKNPRTQYVRQLILYSVMLILCIIAKLWPVMFIFAALIGFSGFMLYRNKDKESYSLADYISKYDKDFPTEDPKAKDKKMNKQYDDERTHAYLRRLEEIEEEFDYDYGDEDED